MGYDSRVWISPVSMAIATKASAARSNSSGRLPARTRKPRSAACSSNSYISGTPPSPRVGIGVSVTEPGRKATAPWRSSRWCPRLLNREERMQPAHIFGAAQALQCFYFDLANALAGEAKILGDFFQGVLAFAADAEAHTDHLFFVGREHAKHNRGFVLNIPVHQGVQNRAGGVSFDQIAENGFPILADW